MSTSFSSSTPDGQPRLFRDPVSGLLAGVAVGVAAHLGVKTSWVRLFFVLTTLFAGAGGVAYALLWIFVPEGRPGGSARRASPAERRQAIGIAVIGVALLMGAASLGIGRWVGWLVGPLIVVAIGAAFIWREADEARRSWWRHTAAGMARPTTAAWWRIIGGIALVVGGLAIFALGQLDFSAARSALIAVALTLVGAAVIVGPWVVRLVRDLGAERRERIRERERAEVAAHLHDSVLQTLALIQRQSDDARQVHRLARRQERELRNWLYGPAGYTNSGSPDPAQRPLYDVEWGPSAGASTSAAAGSDTDMVDRTGKADGSGLADRADKADAVIAEDAGTADPGGTGEVPGGRDRLAGPTATQHDDVVGAVGDFAAAAPQQYTSAHSFAAALAAAAGEVEDTYGIAIAPVVVGDTSMTSPLAAAVAAAREAMVNAAKHSGSDTVSVYAEIEDDVASLFIRDRGVGFDPHVVASDRRGIAESIRGRMDRYGGAAEVRAAPGTGTEVVLTVPLDRSAVEPPTGAPGTAADWTSPESARPRGGQRRGRAGRDRRDRRARRSQR